MRVGHGQRDDFCQHPWLEFDPERCGQHRFGGDFPHVFVYGNGVECCPATQWWGWLRNAVVGIQVTGLDFEKRLNLPRPVVRYGHDGVWADHLRHERGAGTESFIQRRPIDVVLLHKQPGVVPARLRKRCVGK